jgi:hypothetical protein
VDLLVIVGIRVGNTGTDSMSRLPLRGVALNPTIKEFGATCMLCAC